jgi:hypothetical protein
MFITPSFRGWYYKYLEFESMEGKGTGFGCWVNIIMPILQNENIYFTIEEKIYIV